VKIYFKRSSVVKTSRILLKKRPSAEIIRKKNIGGAVQQYGVTLLVSITNFKRTPEIQASMNDCGRNDSNRREERKLRKNRVGI